MKTLTVISLVASLALSSPALAQSAQDVIPSPAPLQEAQPQTNDTESLKKEELSGVLETGPDYSELSPEAEKSARLDVLFERLKGANEEDGKLIAEEIWALWLDSGSPSVNMLLLRGTASEKQKDYKTARRMYDHVTTLLPDYAEGWARSCRLAYLEDDYNRAMQECAKSLILEPREFYALWTMGNILEKLDRSEQAYDIYREALALYPEHPSIKARVEVLQTQIDGSVL